MATFETPDFPYDPSPHVPFRDKKVLEQMREIGPADFKNHPNPNLNVPLGAKHLRMLYDRYDDIAEPDRMRFALAAYNCGQGHLDDARTLARWLGNDPDVWEGSVREALLLLREPNEAPQRGDVRSRLEFSLDQSTSHSRRNGGFKIFLCQLWNVSHRPRSKYK